MKDESKKEVEEKTTDQESSLDETKDNSSKVDETTKKTEEDEEQQDAGTEDEDDVVTMTKAEADLLKKKGEDYEAIINSKKAAKFKQNVLPENSESDVDEEEPDNDDIIKQAREAGADEAKKVLLSSNKEEFDKNLPNALTEWTKLNPWADNDDILGELSAGFDTSGSTKKEDIVAALNRAAINKFPNLYSEAMEKRVKSKILAEKDDIDAGDMGGSSSEKNSETSQSITKEDRRLADKYFGGDIERYIKYKK